MRIQTTWNHSFACQLIMSAFQLVLLRILYSTCPVYSIPVLTCIQSIRTPLPADRKNPWSQSSCHHYEERIAKSKKVEGIVPLFLRITDFHLHAWIQIVENLAVTVLHGASFIGELVWRLFQTATKVVSWFLSPVAIIDSKMALNLKQVNIYLIQGIINSCNDTVSDKTLLCRTGSQKYDSSSYATGSMDPLSRHCPHDNWGPP